MTTQKKQNDKPPASEEPYMVAAKEALETAKWALGVTEKTLVTSADLC